MRFAAKGYEAMRKNKRLPVRVAAGFLALALTAVLLPANCLAASANIPAKVVYTGDGTTKSVQTLNAANLDTFWNLMPGGSTAPQNIVVENRSSRNMGVYFQAQAADDKTAGLLSELQLKVTFKMDDGSAVQTLYDGPASGKSGTSAVSDIVTSPIRLGYVYGNSTSGVISAVLIAPETMQNRFELAQSTLKWTLQFELASPPVSSKPESIGEESTPLVPPSSSKTPGEPIPDEGVPLSPPKTGQNLPIPIFIIGGTALLLMVILIGKRKTE